MNYKKLFAVTFVTLLGLLATTWFVWSVLEIGQLRKEASPWAIVGVMIGGLFGCWVTIGVVVEAGSKLRSWLKEPWTKKGPSSF